MTIKSFHGRYAFLSNFYPVEIEWEGETYSSLEHAYQASKTLVPEERLVIRNASTPGQAKRLGNRVTLRADWERVKVSIMRALIEKKFANPILRAQLIATAGETLIEGNIWGDTFWGICDGKGLNMLGRLLMAERTRCKP